MKRRKLHILLQTSVCIVILTSAFASCSGADPVIYKLNWILQVRANPLVTGKSVEQLIIHILADDEDGFEELYELYVIHNDSELYWRVTSEEWSEFTANEKTWIGINALQTEGKTYVPRGKYRVLLRDLSGYEDEKTFILSTKMTRYTYMTLPIMRVDKNGVYTPEFRRTTDNTQREAEKDFGFLQIMHPQNIQPEIDGKKEDIEYIRSLLGMNGVFYKVAHGSNVSFISEDSVRFSVYLHYRHNSKVMFRVGPYNISLDK